MLHTDRSDEPYQALRDQPGTARSDARDLLSFAHGVGAAGEEDAEPVVIGPYAMKLG